MSSINPNNIDGTYPIAGQDNDSQGFRDNFTNIKNNFSFAYDELTDLQSKVVLKSALSGGSINNDMSYAQLISPQLLKAVETKNDLGTQTSGFDVSWADGHFQYATVGADLSLTFSNWPTSGYYTRLRLQLTTDSSARVVTFPSAVSVGISDIQGASGQAVTLPANGVYLFELTSYDNGTTITIQDLLRNYDIVTTGESGNFTSLNVSGNVLATSATLSTATVNGNLTATGTVTGGTLTDGTASIASGAITGAVSASLSSFLTLTPLSSAPGSPTAGMIAVDDGSDWSGVATGGTDETVVAYLNSGWVKLG